MAEENVTRKLAAILYADVVGYSRLTGTDEEGTHRAVAGYLDVIAGIVSGHDGRVVHYAGDAVLADFGSVVAAVKCAVAVQKDLATRNVDIPVDRKVQFRIGVNLGDVIVDRDDIFGNGVNVAARLESLADPGGICVSGSVLEQVQGKVDMDFQDMGLKDVKNIERRVQAYRVVLERPSAAIPPLPLPDKPAIAVLPFDSLGDDPMAGNLADGLTEDLTAALAKVPQLFVIARNSAATYKGKAVNVQEVAETLGVKYVLEGSVQKSGDRLRITPQLIDATSGGHLWAERYDRPIEDIFALQDEIVRHVLIELQARFTEGDRARIASRGTRNLEAWLLRAQAFAEMDQTQEGTVRARELFEAAHRADPNWARPLSGIALCYYDEARAGWSSSREDSIALGIENAERAIAMDPEEPLSYQALRGLNLLLGNHKKALSLAEKAVSLAPNDYFAAGLLAATLVYMDEPARGLEIFERAKRLGPIIPKWFQRMYGLALHLTGRTDHAIAVFEELARQEPEWFEGLAQLAAAYVSAGRIDAAQATTQNILERDPAYTASRHSVVHLFRDKGRAAWLRDLLVKAGLPE